MADDEKVNVTDPADGVGLHLCHDEDGQPQIGLVLTYEDGEVPPSVHFALKEAREFYKAFGEAIAELEKMVN